MDTPEERERMEKQSKLLACAATYQVSAVSQQLRRVIAAIAPLMDEHDGCLRQFNCCRCPFCQSRPDIWPLLDAIGKCSIALVGVLDRRRPMTTEEDAAMWECIERRERERCEKEDQEEVREALKSLEEIGEGSPSRIKGKKKPKGGDQS